MQLTRMRLFAILLPVAIFAGSLQLAAQTTIDALPDMSADEVFSLLQPEKRQRLAEVSVGAADQSQQIVAAYKQELGNILQETTDPAIRARTQRVLNQISNEEPILLEAIEAELRRQLFLVNLGSDALVTGLLAFSSNRALCDARRPGVYQLLDEVCAARRPDGIPEELPRILDPIIVWYCSLPPAFVPDDVRPICNHASFAGTLYTNPESSPAYLAIENLFRIDTASRAQEANARQELTQTTQDRRADMMACGKIYREAEIQGLMWTRSTADLSEFSDRQIEHIVGVRACRDRFGTEDRDLFRIVTFARGQEAEHLSYCRPYIQAYSKFIDDVLALQRNRNHRFGTPVRESLVATIQKCRSDFSR